MVSIPDGHLLLNVEENCIAGVLILCVLGLKWSFIYAEASEDLQQACMSDSVKRLLEVYEVVENIALVL